MSVQVYLYKRSWHTLQSSQSSESSHVVNKPINAMDACEEFFLSAVVEHILSAARAMFHMTTTDDTPKYKQLFPIGCEKLRLPKRREIILEAAEVIVDKHVTIFRFSVLQEKRKHQN